MDILLTDENPCDNCGDKVKDVWGLFCDIACGKHSTWVIRQEAYKAQLKKVARWLEELPTDGHDKWYFYHKDLAKLLLKEAE